MPDNQVSLPPAVVALTDEAKRIGEKLRQAAELVPGLDLDGVAAAVEELKGVIAGAIVEEAKREIDQAQADANALAAGVVARNPAPGADQRRIAGVEDEMERIRQKLEKAKEHGADAGQLAPLEKLLAGLGEAIRDAALAAAKRELREAADELRRIEAGKPPRPRPGGDRPGPDPDPDPDPPAPDPPGGGGGGGGGTIDVGTIDTPKGDTVGKTRTEAPKPSRIYVKSDDTVWAWSRRDQAWVAQKFGSKLVDVKLIDGGILAIAEHGAALFDAVFGMWLPPLDAGAETLEGGDAG